MAKELYLYSPIYDFVAEDLISKMEDCNPNDVTLRINSPGGNVFAGWGIVGKMKEMQAEDRKVNIKVDGMAASFAAYACLFADDVQALDTSTLMLHRAGFPNNNQKVSAEDQDMLDKMNGDLRSKLEAKIDGKKLKELKGVSIKDMFEAEDRIEVNLTAQEAKQIGLVNKINKINPTEIKAMYDRMYTIAANAETKIIKPSKPNTMDLTKLKAENPSLYNEIFALGLAAGIEKEKDRIGACLEFLEVDAKGVKDAIASGKDLTQKQMAAFAVKGMSAEALKKLGKEAPAAIVTDEPDTIAKTEAEKKIAAFEAHAKKILKLK